MSTFSTTKLSTKGQVVIPEEIRVQLGLKPGAKFIVVAEGDVVVLKTIVAPKLADFASLVARARSEAAELGMQETDIEAAIRDARSKS